jgi:broad specificity phosphatase PhoE
MTVKRVIFIRPGETDWNRLDRWQGWVSSPLNPHGRLQVEALANFLRNIGIGALYASDLTRAAQTAEIISEKTGVQPVYDQNLRERNIGSWQGLMLEEVREWYPDAYDQYIGSPNDYKIPGGESLREVKARMKQAFDKITAIDNVETVGVVTHTVSTRALLEDLVTGYEPRTMRLGNSSVTTIRLGDAGWTIVASNDIEHLEGLDSRAVRELGDKK